MRKTWIAAAAVMLACIGCNQAEIEQLKKGQQDILTKLDSIEKGLAQARTAQATPPRPSAPDPGKVYNIPVADNVIRGPKAAKVTIVEFSDFQCPFCAQSAPLIDQVMKEYPKDVNFVYKQFPLTQIHPNAMGAAKAVVAAGKQGKFWEMHDVLFKNSRELQPEKLKDYAKQAGVPDLGRWEKDYNSPDVQAVVTQDMKDAQTAEVRGTPTFFVNGKRLMNRSPEGFKQMIDEALGKS